jgi:hypothetical protein
MIHNKVELIVNVVCDACCGGANDLKPGIVHAPDRKPAQETSHRVCPQVTES